MTDPQVPGSWSSTTDPDQDSATYISTGLLKRRAEFLTPSRVRIKVATWNVGNLGDACQRDLIDWLEPDHRVDTPMCKVNSSTTKVFGVDGAGGSKEKLDGEEGEGGGEGGAYDIYALGLQEVVDVTQTQTFLGYMDPKIALNWTAHAQAALPAGYTCVASPQLIGMLLLVFVSPELLARCSSVATSTVGTGLMGYVGNKGGVGVRVVLGDTLRLAFVNVHLAAFANATERRNWDASEVRRRMVFDDVQKDVVGLRTVSDGGEGLDDVDVTLWCGDLNYRVDLPNEDIRRLLAPYMPPDLPPTHADASAISSPITGPREGPKLPPLPTEAHPDAVDTLEGTIASLLKHDQLRKVRAEKKAWAGFREGSIGWLPTYKYDVGTLGKWDSSEKQRTPSWCDRVLSRMRGEDGFGAATEGGDEMTEAVLLEKEDGVHRVRSDTIHSETLFIHDAGSDDEEEDLVVSRGDFPPPPTSPLRKTLRKSIETLRFDSPTSTLTTPFGAVSLVQQSYTSHQNIVSSDHKPVTATFSLSFPASDAAARKTVHADLAREADKLENERRPAVTLIIDEPATGGDENLIPFGSVCFLAPESRSLTIANTGTVPAQLSLLPFTSPVLTASPHPSEASPSILEPGETLPLTLTISITTPAAVRALNDKTLNLDTVLVLRVKDGRDVFLPLTATWEPSAFAAPLQELLRVPEGKGGYRGWLNRGMRETRAIYNAPRELWRLTEITLAKLQAGHGSWPSLSPTSGDSNDDDGGAETEVWNALDTDTPFPAHTTASAAATALLRWLAALPTPIVPADLILCATPLEPEVVLDRLPRGHANVAVGVCGFVGEVIGVLGEKEDVVERVVGDVARVLVRREGADVEVRLPGEGTGTALKPGPTGNKEKEEERRIKSWVRMFVEV